MIALLNRWASLQHVAPGLARLCGWLPLVAIRVPLGLSVLPDGTRVSLRVYDDGSKSVAVWEDDPSLRDVQRQQAEAPEYFGKTWDDLAINILEPDDGK